MSDMKPKDKAARKTRGFLSVRQLADIRALGHGDDVVLAAVRRLQLHVGVRAGAVLVDCALEPVAFGFKFGEGFGVNECAA